MTDELFLFATVAGTGIAMPTSDLEAVVRLGEIVPIARAAPHVRGLAALRSRVLTVVDVRCLITGVQSELEAKPMSIVADIDGHSYGLLIDNVSDITAVEDGILPIRGRVSEDWAPYAQGMLLYEGTLHLAVSIEDFIRGPVLAAA